jgi:superfamily II DNA or RNA helicase
MRSKDKEITTGLYEQLINSIIQIKLAQLDKNNYFIEKDKIDEAEGEVLLANYLTKIVEQVLSDQDSLEDQVNIVNQIMNLLGKYTQEIPIDNYKIPPEVELLLAVFQKNNPLDKIQVNRPITPLSESSLFTGSKQEPTLLSEIKKEILSSDQVDILMSFIKWTGVRGFIDALEAFTNKDGRKLRIISTCYTGATDSRAIEYLSKLPNTEVKISYDTEITRLHAKAYMFHRKSGFSTAYIGSSNISRAAMSSGLEWNMKVTSQESPHILDKFKGTFETYWNDKTYELYDYEKDKLKLQKALKKEIKPDEAKEFYFFDIRPYVFQQEILDQLETERVVYHSYRNLIVAATGTGKTVVSAFDYKRFCENNPRQKNRLLFVAHREEILKQSLNTFRSILRNANFGDLMVGEYEPDQMEYLFTSIQSANSKGLIRTLPKNYYDYIIVDETHHGKAPSYGDLLTYFQPKILLGLTATPERMDGKNILEYFDDHIAAEIRLPEAIDRKLLCPFQYFGISDNVDLSNVQWRNGGYDVNELDVLFTNNNQRADSIVRSVKEYVTNPLDTRGLGFCVTKAHAQFMARYFNSRGIPSEALTSDSPDEIRSSVQQRLLNREINFIFSVDLYNEGVDIPEIDTVLFLRPTQSITVFLQQLGRGLRHSENKDCLTVLDFIGQAHSKYNYEEKYRALLGRTKRSVEWEVESEFPHLPAGCFIKLERIAAKYVLNNIKEHLITNQNKLVIKIKSFHEESGLELTLSNFLHYYNLSLPDIYTKSTWTDLCYKAGLYEKPLEYPELINPQSSLKRIIHINSPIYLEFLLSIFKGKFDLNEDLLSPEEHQMAMMFYYAFWQKTADNLRIKSLSDSFFQIKKYPSLLKEIIDILDYKYKNIRNLPKKIELPNPSALELHGLYIRDEILASYGNCTLYNSPSSREGILYVNDKNVDLLFVTLNKSEKDYSPSTLYRDYAISDKRFHWQSQSTTSDCCPTALRYFSPENPNHRILLFVREYKKENNITSPYYYLGPVKYLSHEGSSPINIVWELEHPMPAHIVRVSEKLE